MNPQSIPEKPLLAGLNTKGAEINALKTVYFFEREDGTTFCAETAEAWGVYKRKNQIIGSERPKNKLIGTSNGALYRKAVLESQEVFKTSGLEAAQARLRQGYEEELAEARKHPIVPPNMDKVDFRGNPTNIQL